MKSKFQLKSMELHTIFPYFIITKTIDKFNAHN